MVEQKDLEIFAGAVMFDREFVKALYAARHNIEELTEVLGKKGIEAAGDYAVAIHEDKLDWAAWKKIYEGFHGPMAST